MTDATNSPMMTSLLATRTDAERLAGRFLRAPDGHDDPPADPPADPDPVDPPADPAPSGPADPPADPDPKEEPEDKSLMGKAKDGEKDEAPAAPEKYELTPPEGFAIDEDLLGKADPVFRELGLSNEAANKLMPLIPEFAEKLVSAQKDAWDAETAKWAKDSMADKELGGANWAETESLVAKALDQFGAPELVKVLDEYKIGNHPELIRAWRKIGQQLGEGGDFVRPDTGAPVKIDRLEELYPEDIPKKETV